MSPVTGVGGICRDEQALVRAVERMREQGYLEVTTFSPFPTERLLTGPAAPPSPIPFYTITGGVVGFVTGLCFPIWSSLQWSIIGGGKPVVSVPPFLVIAFELTMLFAGVFTAAGLVIHAGLLRRAPQPSPQGIYHPRFSEDRFGIFVTCPIEKVEQVKQLALAAGLEEVSVAGG